MKKNIFLSILVCITAAAMIIGILWHVTGTIHPGRKSNSVREAVGEERDTLKEKTASVKKKQTAQNADTKDSNEKNRLIPDAEKDEDLRALEINMYIGDISVRQGTELEVKYSGDEKYEPEIRQEKGVVSVVQPDRHSIFNLGNVHAKLTVTLPEGISLDRAEIYEDLGDIEVTDLTADEVIIDNDLGDIYLKSCLAADLDIVSDLGDVTVEQCVFSRLDVEQDLGDVDISTPQDLSEATLDLETDLGTVKIDEEDQGRRHTHKGNGEISITVKNDSGDIKLNSAN